MSETIISKGENKHPEEELLQVAEELGYNLEDVEFARHMDKIDPLRKLREDFHYPKMKTIQGAELSLVDPDEDCVYFSGNSLGLCPKSTKKYMDVELDKWAETALEGHTNGDLPWAWCDECLQDDMGALVGGKTGEVAIMNGLTVNLHLLLISFYRPTPDRHKILMEDHAFPSDHYAVESQIRLKGFNPETSMLLMKPREGEHLLREEDVLRLIQDEGDSIALVCFSGLQYYTGQKFNIPRITKAGHEKGCVVGWDLAHAAGNIELQLHDWDVDFACWCSYKYLNAGAGNLSGLFLHEKHFRHSYPQLHGWWGHEHKTRFTMDNKFDPYPGALSFRLSNTPGLLCPPIKASLEVFKKTSMSEITRKCRLLTGYLESRIKKKYGYHGDQNSVEENPHAKHVHVEILTPADPSERGAQLSLSFSVDIMQVFDELTKRGVLCDVRKPRVIRVAPVPLYCSFEDVHRFMKYLDQALHAAKVEVD